MSSGASLVSSHALTEVYLRNSWKIIFYLPGKIQQSGSKVTFSFGIKTFTQILPYFGWPHCHGAMKALVSVNPSKGSKSKEDAITIRMQLD